MKCTFSKVSTFNLRNMIGHDHPEEFILAHEACIRDSTAIWIGRADGIDACAVGVIPYGSIFSDTAYVWLIYTKMCQQHPARFARWSRRAIDEIRRDYPILVGLCRCDHPHSQAWLKWLGAVFDHNLVVNGCWRFRIG